jgi:hypothetical protein
MKAHAYMALNLEPGSIPNDLAENSWGDSVSVLDPLRLGQKKYTEQITKRTRTNQAHQDMLTLLIQYLYKIPSFSLFSVPHIIISAG